MTNDDFYIGYLPKATRGAVALVRRVVPLLVLFALVLAGWIASVQQPASVKAFEWGETRRLIGWVEAEPVPTLAVRRPGALADAEDRETEGWSRFLLVHPFKYGAEVAEHDGRLVELEGTLIYRDGRTMVEVVPDSVTPLAKDALPGDEASASRAPSAGLEDLGEHTLVGEIVDSKCYLGVMTPGDTKLHRACATLCIAGGIPPVFLVRESEDRALYLLLIDEDGSTVNERVLDRIAEPLEITGRVRRRGDLLFLEADPGAYRRIP